MRAPVAKENRRWRQTRADAERSLLSRASPDVSPHDIVSLSEGRLRSPRSTYDLRQKLQGLLPQVRCRDGHATSWAILPLAIDIN